MYPLIMGTVSGVVPVILGSAFTLAWLVVPLYGTYIEYKENKKNREGE